MAHDGPSDPRSRFFPSDDSIMSEVQKLNEWKKEGIDTSELEKLLFSDPDAYTKEKIRILTEKLERAEGVDKYARPMNDTEFEVKKLLPLEEKEHVITNNLTEDPKVGVNPPPVDHENKPEPSIDEDHPGKRYLRFGRYRIDRGKIRSFTIGVIVITIVIIMTGIGTYLLFLKPHEEPLRPTATFIISDLHPISGSILNLTADPVPEEYDHYKWFGRDEEHLIVFHESG
jgi:hypothetical protein